MTQSSYLFIIIFVSKTNCLIVIRFDGVTRAVTTDIVFTDEVFPNCLFWGFAVHWWRNNHNKTLSLLTIMRQLSLNLATFVTRLGAFQLCFGTFRLTWTCVGVCTSWVETISSGLYFDVGVK